jgi:hypothetical protein
MTGPTGVSWRMPHGGIELAPMWYLRLPSEEAACAIASRAILLKVQTI